MNAYHGDPAVKAKYVARFAAHRAADEVIQGTGFNDGRGCFVGCTLDSYAHELFPVELGWPEWLAQLADTIFEGLPNSEAPQFGTDLLESTPVGVDLDKARVPFLVSMQRRNLARLAGNTEPYAEQCRIDIQGVIDFLLSAVESAAVESAAESAWSAVESARSAVESARSARSAARSARSARSAARSARSARSENQAQRDDLLSIIKELK